MAAIRAPVENSHRFVRTSDLDGFEIREVVPACGLIDTEYACLVYIFPGIFSAKHVVDLFAL